MKNISNPNHSAHIVVLSSVEKHPNADRLQKATAFGSGIIVGLDAKDGDVGIYFQSGLALDAQFAASNDLIRRKNAETGAAEGGMLEANGRIKSQRFRGEVSDGLFLPLDSLMLAGLEPEIVKDLQPGDYFEELDGIKICTKYIPKTKNQGGASGTSMKKARGSIMFKEHYETPQLRFNLHMLDKTQYIVVTEKLHGTSQRIANVQTKKKLSGFKLLLAKIFGFPIENTSWDEMIGTRHTVLDSTNDSGFYSNDFRFEASMPFFDKLQKGETIFYEVVGYSGDRPIMGTVDNEKLGPEFVKKYGKKTTFTYGCEPEQFDIYVYRITMTNEDGYTMDYTWDATEKRCGELGVKHVPVLFKGTFTEFIGDHDHELLERNEIIERVANIYVDGKSTVDPKHIKEGIVIRVEGTAQPKVYKHKSFEFKVLEGILKPETSGIEEGEEL